MMTKYLKGSTLTGPGETRIQCQIYTPISLFYGVRPALSMFTSSTQEQCREFLSLRVRVNCMYHATIVSPQLSQETRPRYSVHPM